MVELNLGGDDDAIVCEGCGAELPAFLDGCPYCDDGEEAPEETTLPCPECGVEIHEDSERCPVCGAWVVMGSRRGGRGARWVVALLILLLLLWLVSGLL